jgi:hypothetical protein
MKIGMLGAGLIAQAVATLARQKGHEVMVSNSRGPQTLGELAAALGCQAGTAEEAAAFGDIVLVAIPFHACRTLSARSLEGKVVMDACNHYPGRDGADAALDAMSDTSGQVLARQLPGARVVKVFNAIMAKDIVPHARVNGTNGTNDTNGTSDPRDRRALPIAGDDAAARQQVATFLDEIGYDAVDAGPLAESWRFERGMPGYCIPLRSASMARALQAAEKGLRVPDGSWRTPRELT